MPPDAQPELAATGCPHCGKTFAVAAAHAGKRARCSGCGQTFLIELRTAAPAPVAAAAPRVARPESSMGVGVVPGPTTPFAQPQGVPPRPAGAAGAPRPVAVAPVPAASTGGSCCAICQSPLAPGEAAVDCPGCKARYHEECWTYNGGCGVYGCEQAPPTERLTSLEIPASFWGREEKPCPNCGQMIMAAAVRCRHCGATFASAAPEGAADYRRQQVLRAKLPGVLTAGIWLLAFSLIPCTAPFAAVIGLIWYLNHRQAIRALPPLHAAVCKIAVAVAWAQSGLLIVCGILASMAHGALP